ncbi:Hypothetical predicted protein [Xyrichtys novacula]|uniref:Uncharacterized protein n=1 Tax=Xyrichtys novacula TaxID=13765 RepID=A0AAV1GXH2_XYRNO|nr:Hypothetical predicted protein [Xyrichtys novacula]
MTDPAGEDFCHALGAQGRRLTELERAISSLGPGVPSLSAQLQALATQTNQLMVRLDTLPTAASSPDISSSPSVPSASLGHYSEPSAPPIESDLVAEQQSDPSLKKLFDQVRPATGGYQGAVRSVSEVGSTWARCLPTYKYPAFSTSSLSPSLRADGFVFCFTHPTP